MATTTPLSPRLLITTAGWLATFIFGSPFCFAQAGAPPTQFTLANDAISATWSVRDGGLRWRSFKNGFTKATLTSDAPVFELLPKEGSVLSSAGLKMLAPPVVEDLASQPNSSQAAARIPGRQARVEFQDAAGTRIAWKAILRNGTNYIRQEVTIHAGPQLAPI